MSGCSYFFFLVAALLLVDFLAGAAFLAPLLFLVAIDVTSSTGGSPPTE
ncbi:MAG: hypothetical protein ACRDXD_05385 [Acidimicrobiia bacterium]